MTTRTFRIGDQVRLHGVLPARRMESLGWAVRPGHHRPEIVPGISG